MTDFQQQIGPFRLYSEIGRTPISNRYRATDGRNGETVTLHILTAESRQQPALVEQFLTIGRQAMRLQHPGIVPIVDVGETQGFVYIATQAVQVQSLAERLHWATNVVTIEAAAYILNALASALDYAHSHGLVHGHITLDQIYITDDNEVILDGFAEAIRVDQASPTASNGADETTISNPLVFVSPFMAPEQAKTGEALDYRADIYSLGAILYTMLLGRPPFTAAGSEELLYEIAETPPTPPESINPALPAAMIYVLKLVLAKDPTARYTSAGEFANAFLQSSQWRTATPTVEQPATYRRRGLAALILLPLLAVLTFVILSGAGMGWLGERFAVLSSGQGDGIIAQLRTLLSPSGVVAQLTAEPVQLTPIPIMTLTPPPPTQSSALVTETPTVAVAVAVSDTAPITAALTPVSTTSAVTTTATAEGTLVDAGANITATNASSATRVALVIDPLGLLEGDISTGEVIINGTAAPGAFVQVQVNGETIGSTTTKVSGTWSLIVDLSQPGTYDITAQVLTDSGAVMTTAQRAVTMVDATATPTIRLALTATAAVTTTAVATATSTQPANTPTATNTTLPTATSTTLPTVTNTNTVQPTATNTPQPTATSTNTAIPTATNTLQPTATNTNTALPTATNTALPTATQSATVAPTATRTNTAIPTATNTATLAPTATNTPRPPATNTPRPTATNTALPTATYTHTALPTATNTATLAPTATNTPRPPATNTPRPTATHTAIPTATNTPRPTATNTPRPTATNTPRPTATNTAIPTATNTPLPTATNTPVPTATNTPLPPTMTLVPTATNTPRPTNTPTATATSTPPPPPTAAVGSIEPVSPSDGDSGQGQHAFSWTANFTPSEGYAFELVFWRPGQDPMGQSIGLAAPTTNLNVTLDLPRLDEQLGNLFDTGEYNWGVLLVRTTPSYERIKYLGGGRRFIYYRGDSGSGGQSSGE